MLNKCLTSCKMPWKHETYGNIGKPMTPCPVESHVPSGAQVAETRASISRMADSKARTKDLRRLAWRTIRTEDAETVPVARKRLGFYRDSIPFD